MAVVFSGIAAHTPLLMPTIGKEAFAQLEKTKLAMQTLEQELYVTNPEIIVIISPHGDLLPDAMTINLASKYVSNFQEFGDLVTKLEWKTDIMLIDRIREDFKEKGQPLVLGSTETIDYGVSVPLSYLTAHLPNVRIVPISVSQLDMKAHYEFGKHLKDELMSSTKRVAIIASLDMSQRVGENSPAGFSAKGVSFDEKVIESLTKRPLEVLDIDEAWTAEAQACGAKVVAMMCGILDDVKHETKVLSYEKPFGAGYLVAHSKIG